MICYSFFEDGEGVETLSQHLKFALSELKAKFLSRGYHVRVARLVGTDEETARDLLKLTVLLHDIGKGATEYQSRGRGFSGHEYFSALIAHRSVTLQREFVSHMALAIYLHHHTMIGRRPPAGRHELADECVEEFTSLVDEEGLIDLVNVDILRRTFGCEESRRLVSQLRAWARRDPLPCLAILYPLVIVDNLAAFRGRGGKEGVLLKEIARSYGSRGLA